MKKKTRSITVITTTIQKRIHYVSKFTGRNDGRFNIELTTDVKDAYDFSLPKANEVVKKAFNPHDRKYVVEDTLVE